MVQYKTVSLPSSVADCKIKVAKDMIKANKQEVAESAIEPIARLIEEEAKKGWHFHSVNVVPAFAPRKKGIAEMIFGWIPIIGRLIWGNLPPYYFPQYYAVIFQREI